MVVHFEGEPLFRLYKYVGEFSEPNIRAIRSHFGDFWAIFIGSLCYACSRPSNLLIFKLFRETTNQIIEYFSYS